MNKIILPILKLFFFEKHEVDELTKACIHGALNEYRILEAQLGAYHGIQNAIKECFPGHNLKHNIKRLQQIQNILTEDEFHDLYQFLTKQK